MPMRETPMPQSSVAETITQGPPRRLLDGKKRVLTSAMLVALGLWIRLGVSDAPAFKELKDSGNVAKTPLHDALTKFPRLLLVTSGLHLAQNSVFYLITVYTLSYLADNRDDSTAGVTAVMIASAIGLFTEPLWGGGGVGL
ncbi:hypothetical protein BANT918_01761 [Brevibacterium antiquum CNRZ 918]|uniref:Uncharacterized protein n=2 Tax=Brevibacterium antiquum TaxID=234835 RepID=A0A2H1JPQ9_9MICO|nr:hypothetical protein BANT918_01761 [Brevibacterium antiquum CNRZ 918]